MQESEPSALHEVASVPTAPPDAESDERAGARLTTRALSDSRMPQTIRTITTSPLLIRVVASLMWLFWSSRLYVEIGIFPTAAIWSISFGIGSVALLALYSLARSRRILECLDAILVVGSLLAGIIWVVALVYGNPSFGTDEAAFVQAAAQLLVHGHNPYGVNLGWALQKFGVQPSSYTYMTTGHLITQLNYPALSFLPEAALIGLGLSSQATTWVCAGSLAISGLVLFAAVPRPYRPLGALLLGLDAYFDGAASGLIFTQMMLFIVIAVVTWNGSVRRLPGWRGWTSPVALGLAISVQQTSWFLLPCFLVAVYQEARLVGARPWTTLLRYGALVGGVVLLVNGPFIVMGPMVWIEGVLTPMRLSLMPLGQGFIGLTTYMGIGGGNLSLYTVTSLIVLATLLLLLAFEYRRTRLLVPLTPAIVLWFTTRSLEEYLLVATYALLAALCTWSAHPEAERRTSTPKGRHLRARLSAVGRAPSFGGWSLAGVLVVFLGSVVGVGTLAGALSSGSPLSIRILSYHETGEEQTIDSLQVSVDNRTGVPKNPTFVVEGGPYIGTPWLLEGAAHPIPAHSARTLTLLAPNISVMPSLSSAFKVAAFTSSPVAVSTSPALLPDSDRTSLTPLGFSDVVPVGSPITLFVQVESRLGSPVRRAGIEVQLGQEVYAPSGLFPAENSINGAPEGQSPVSARTNPQGIARFRIVANQTQGVASTFQAWLGGSGPSGYSNRVIVWLGYSPYGAHY